MDGDRVTIENVVGTGSINYIQKGENRGRKFEVAVDVLAENLGPRTWSNEGPHPGLHMRIDEDDDKSPLTTFYRSGKYIIRAESLERLHEENERVIEELRRIELIDDSKHELGFTISNIVCVADMETEINLEALAIALDLEKVEYEPEQFPALIYRDPDAYACTFLIFANGKVVIPGGTDIKKIRKSFEEFTEHIESFGLL